MTGRLPKYLELDKYGIRPEDIVRMYVTTIIEGLNF